MRICLYPYSEGSGTGTYILELARGLRKRGHEIIVIGTAQETARKNGFQFIQTPSAIKSQYNKLWQLPPFSYIDFFLTKKYLCPILVKLQPDIVHLSTHLDISSLPGKKIVTSWDSARSIVGSINLATKYSNILLLPYRILREIEMNLKDRIMYHQVDLVLGINEEVTTSWQMKGIAAIHIPPGIEIPNITPIKNKTLTLCFIARNHIWIRRKGLRYLLNALMIIKQKCPQLDYKLHIIGKIPWYSKLILRKYKLLENHILMEGLLSRNNVLEIIEHSHIQIIPSVYEEFGYAALEAMAYGTVPIVSEGNHSLNEMVRDGAGISVDIYCAEAFAKKMQQLMSDKQMLTTLQQKVFNRVNSIYNIDNVAKKMDSIYMELLKKKY